MKSIYFTILSNPREYAWNYTNAQANVFVSVPTSMHFDRMMRTFDQEVRNVLMDSIQILINTYEIN